MLHEDLLLIQSFDHILNLLEIFKSPKIVNLTMLLFLEYIFIVDILVTLKLSKDTLTFTFHQTLKHTGQTPAINELPYPLLTYVFNRLLTFGITKVGITLFIVLIILLLLPFNKLSMIGIIFSYFSLI